MRGFGFPTAAAKMAHKAVRNFMGSLIQKRWNHSPVALVLPEFENTPKTVIPHLPSGASMELMAVPKKKVIALLVFLSPHPVKFGF